MKALFNRFYETYHQDIYNYVFYMVKDKTITEDIVQEVYIRVIKSYDRFRGDSSEKTWAFSIARHIVFDHFRKQKRKRKVTNETIDLDDMTEFIPARETTPDEAIIHQEDVALMYQLLDQCSVNQKQVVILRYIQHHSLKETAEILDLTVSNVKTLQHRAIKKLKSLLDEEKAKGGIMDDETRR
ncbi:sigma-70 family RNA polymerase sigma factor [Oceanobacillus alkalisoli]|uniref:sigma-70 family RNA polymerase sigma factor n=1 Tax=Oceanobacillus alkalisoli TaxID=2925113 RepID=UPI001F1216B3|nr:sigma-70 family RNA polymerase sigma factor [Oceanobacillus alkalisoli]MCF3941672.1 sigma-70 family RNA polymerase sigma factor [Oceanobacillus alkalisoli]